MHVYVDAMSSAGDVQSTGTLDHLRDRRQDQMRRVRHAARSHYGIEGLHCQDTPGDVSRDRAGIDIAAIQRLGLSSITAHGDVCWHGWNASTVQEEAGE